MQDLIEELVRELTDEPVLVSIDNSLDCLGATYANPDSYVIEVNVEAHSAIFGADALEQLQDTIRHEVAHVLHLASIHDEIVALANEYEAAYLDGAKKLGLQGLPYERHFQSARRSLSHGTNSHHGAAWKKMARKTGATPKAKADV